MKCPNCGRTNGKSNKYCRECGTRLDVLSAGQDSESRPDEVGLGAELFSVIELFESGDVDAALEKGQKLADANPGSASAHSIVALIYERKAQDEAAEGDPERSRAFLKLAIDHYEEIIDLNPDSSADREKLAVLRLRYNGHEPAPEKAESRIIEALKLVPVPVWAGLGAFILVLAVVAILTRPADTKPQSTAKMARPAANPSVNIAPSPNAGPQLSVFTYPNAANPPLEPAQGMPVPRPSIQTRATASAGVKPIRVPRIDQELTLVAEPKAPPKKPADAVKPANGNAPDREPVVVPTGRGLLAQAIELHNQGRTSEAIGVANQAIVLFRADVDAGKGVETARRGIANATKFIAIWQDTTGSSLD